MLFCMESRETYLSPGVQSFIEQQLTKPNKQWIYEVLDGSRERDRVVYRDPVNRFVLLPCPDDGRGVSKGFIAIIADRALRSLRDLRAEHVGLLEDVRDECAKRLPPSFTHCSLHYHPSVYQLHMHFRDAQLVRWPTEPRVFMLDTVLANLRADSEHYANATLVFNALNGSDIVRVLRESASSGSKHLVVESGGILRRPRPYASSSWRRTPAPLLLVP
jgi:hypothetical protein